MVGSNIMSHCYFPRMIYHGRGNPSKHFMKADIYGMMKGRGERDLHNFTPGSVLIPALRDFPPDTAETRISPSSSAVCNK